jgi:hypothetical protein
VLLSLAHSVAENGELASISLPYRVLLTYSSSAHCVRVSTVPVYGMASSGCSHSSVHYGHGGLSSQSRNVGISARRVVCGAGPASSSSDT